MPKKERFWHVLTLNRLDTSRHAGPVLIAREGRETEKMDEATTPVGRLSFPATIRIRKKKRERERERKKAGSGSEEWLFDRLRRANGNASSSRLYITSYGSCSYWTFHWHQFEFKRQFRCQTVVYNTVNVGVKEKKKK